MNVITAFITIILSLFSTGVMSYISMATPIGPWMEPTVFLCAYIIFNFIFRSLNKTENLVLTVSGASIGGIITTALGFSFPALYFIDKSLFNSWLQMPIYFCFVVTLLALSASLFGFWIANMLENKLIVEQQLAFPIGQLVHKMISAQNQLRKAKELVIGFFSTILFCIGQDGFWRFNGIIPRYLTLIKPFSINKFNFPIIRFDLFPIYWSIGFVAGNIIAIPLFIGALSKIFIVDPINIMFFQNLSGVTFTLAFSSGMVLESAFFSLVSAPKVFWKSIKQISAEKFIGNSNSDFKINFYETVPFILIVGIFLFYFNFPFITQIYLLFFTFICAYQITTIAGKIGLAQLGRFATFVMVPAMLSFKLSYLQIVFIATFVEICGGVATDVLFGRKLAQLSDVSNKKIKLYQLLGIIISCMSAGIFFWLLINKFTLGSSELFAQKAYARALLIDSINFDFYVLVLGAIFSFILKKLKVNSMLALGGLLMPIDISLGLVAGAVFASFVKDKEEWQPFWSGVFAAHSIWMIIKALL